MTYASIIEPALQIPEWIERQGVEVQNRDYLALEAMARRQARRQDLHLAKCRTRNPGAINFGGFMLIDPALNFAVAGAYPLPFSLNLSEVFQELEALAAG